jgi:hypothetical protein
MGERSVKYSNSAYPPFVMVGGQQNKVKMRYNNSQTFPHNDSSSESPANYEKIAREKRNADKAKTTKDLTIATSVLGSTAALGVGLTIFAFLFPPITAPIAIGIGIGTAVVGTSAAGVGIASAVVANQKEDDEPPPYTDYGN